MEPTQFRQINKDILSVVYNKKKLGISESNTLLRIDHLIKEMTTQVALDSKIEIRGFGGFVKKHRKARQGINPKTSERTQVEEKYVPFFKPGKSLKEMVNKD